MFKSSATSFAVLVTAAYLACTSTFSSVWALPQRPVTSDYILKSSFTLPASLAGEWRLQPDAPPADYLMDLRFSLAPQPDNIRTLHETLISNDPSNPQWTVRKHLSKNEVASLAAPHSDSVTRFRAYLASHGVDSNDIVYSADNNNKGHYSLTSSSIIVLPNISVALAERMLKTRYGIYKHAKTGRQVVRALEYSLPADVHADIEWVQPTNYFGNVVAHSSMAYREPRPGAVGGEVLGAAGIAQTSSTNATLQLIKELYNTANYTASVTPKTARNKLGIAGYLEEYANLADLAQFYELNLPAAAVAHSKPSIVLINGALNPQNASSAGLEANLDTQFGGGMSFPVPNIFYSVYGRGQNTQANISYEDNGNEPYDVFLSYLLSLNDSDPNLPLVLSSSYGEPEDQVPAEYAKSVCLMYAQLGARGVSVLHSSGDEGVGIGSTIGSPACTTGEGSPNLFRANFPATCPYVTAVGGTNGIPETTDRISGGGFSNYFQRPSYQDTAVSKYVSALGNSYEGSYNVVGRGIPDISAQSHNYQVVIAGQVTGVSGTSASCPVVAGIVTLLNDVLLKQGREPLGFLNPFLYSLAIPGLNDITTGSNPGCGTTGFNATAGWDPATGNGTPNFALLRQILSSPSYVPVNNTIVVPESITGSSTTSASVAQQTPASSRSSGGASRGRGVGVGTGLLVMSALGLSSSLWI